MTEERFKFRRVNELTGLFVIAAAIVVVLMVILSGSAQSWFARKFDFKVQLPEQGASGLSRGDEVYLLGVSVGTVGNISVDDQGHMMARVRIREDFARFVCMDSTASIKKVFGVAGDSYLEISRGTGTPLRSGDTITCQETEEMSSQVDKLLNQIRDEIVPVIHQTGDMASEWAELGTNLNEANKQLEQIFARADNIADGLQHGQGAAGELISDPKTADELRQVLVESDAAIAQLRTSLTNLETGTEHLPEVDNALANEAKDLPGLVRQTQSTMRELDRLIEAMQHNWLVRKYVNHTNPPPIVVDITNPPVATDPGP
jgi:phospholipid/cholesterol/gamma-HCH transport system substrate-binding protein